MGPVTSANLYQLINHTAQRDYHAEQDTDFPEIFIYSMPLTGFDETGFVDKASVLDQLVRGVQKLESSGSDFIIIPCNTVHHFIDEMRAAVRIPILSIIEETIDRVAQADIGTVGLLSSESTRHFNLYEAALTARSIDTISASDAEQDIINKAILHVMGGAQNSEDTVNLKLIAERMIREGAEGIVLGCTELPLVLAQRDINVRLFSSTQILASAALARAYQEPS